MARLADDVAATARPDWTRAFASMEDATARLLPYHVMSGEDPAEADIEGASAAPITAPLLCSRFAFRV